MRIRAQCFLVRYVLSLWLMLDGGLACRLILGNEPTTAEHRMELGQTAYDRGAFEEALAQWRQAEQLCAARSNTNGRVKALVNLGAAYQALGQHRLAFRALEQAGQLAENSRNRP